VHVYRDTIVFSFGLVPCNLSELVLFLGNPVESVCVLIMASVNNLLLLIPM
jgi:hypothetical protein